MKMCIKCNVAKEPSMFYRHSGTSDGLTPQCKDCKNAQNKIWREANRDRHNANGRAWRDKNKENIKWASLKKKFNLTQQQYEDLLLSQNGVCGICQRKPDRHGFHVDHDHACCAESSTSCGECVRGLLCFRCNIALGHFSDDPCTLLSAVDYLTKPRLTR